MNIIQTTNLTKSYADYTAVSELNLHIPQGSVYGFLGPNGAGKSTTMKMLLGLTRPTSGSFTIDGKQYPKDRVEILREVGSFIEAPAFYGNLTGRENLDIIRKILKLPKSAVSDALELVAMIPYKDRLAKRYSLGMKQRLGLAGALIGRPPILILDEPTNGLDPVGIHEIRTLIRSLPQKLGCTVLVSSHLLSEIELMADIVGILNRGHLLFEGTPEELKQTVKAQGCPTDNLEDTFLALIDADNSHRGAIQGGAR
ncbi:MAG: ABC transporter ATP-binding protein [Acetatifactor sp.]|nr:ABC transporter ATP-binding protein [Acetatifactor sp.]